MSEWIEWNGGECPVPGDTRVDIMTRNGDVSSGGLTAKSWFWNHDGDSSDIIAYRIVEQSPAPTDAPKTLRDEYCMAILTGMIANEYYNGATPKEIIKDAFDWADQCMEARKQ